MNQVIGPQLPCFIQTCALSSSAFANAAWPPAAIVPMVWESTMCICLSASTRALSQVKTGPTQDFRKPSASSHISGFLPDRAQPRRDGDHRDPDGEITEHLRVRL